MSNNVPCCTLIHWADPSLGDSIDGPGGQLSRLTKKGANVFFRSPDYPGLVIIRPALTQEQVWEAIGKEVEVRVLPINHPDLPIVAEYPPAP